MRIKLLKMSRKVHCSCESDLQRFFSSQVGSGFSDISVFKGSPYQRGYGIGTLIGRFGIPILKFLGKQFLRTGVNVGADMLAKKRFKDALKARAKEGMINATSESIAKVNKILEQKGSGNVGIQAYKKMMRVVSGRKKRKKSSTASSDRRKKGAKRVKRRQKIKNRRKKDIFG